MSDERTSPSRDTVSHVVDDESLEARGRRVRTGGLVFPLALVIAGLSGWLGVRTGSAQARGPGGMTIEVTYPQVARPGLAAPLGVEIRDPSGFDAPIEVALPTSYVQAFDENGFHPDPADATADDEHTRWTFDPPEGDVLTVWFDHRLEPGVQWRFHGAVTVTVADRTAHVSFTTWVLP